MDKINEFHKNQMDSIFDSIMGKKDWIKPLNSLTKTCPRCEGEGKYAVQDGPDDYQWVACDCPKGEKYEQI